MKKDFKTTLRSIIKIISRNKKVLLIFLPIFIINVWFFVLLYTLSKVPFYTLTSGLGTDLIASHVYFVHGFNGNDYQFQDLINYLNSTNFFERNPTVNVTPLYFNFYEKYYNLHMTKKEIHNIKGGISTYARDFYEQLRGSHNSPTQIDIVAHSLGGLITREMLRIYRSELEKSGIQVLRVITLGTPHLGTEILNHPLTKQILWFFGHDYGTLIERSISPGSTFLSRLNKNSSSYMENIEWFFIAGVSLHPLAVFVQEIVFNGVPCDGLVDCKSALALGLTFETINRKIIHKDHGQLICDPQNQESYKYINRWLSASP
ncbi:MAG: esterase/lipase family protein [Candidatus Hodarchaeota archaeon]